MFAQFILQVPEGKANDLWGYSLFVEVIGIKDGTKTKYIYTMTHTPMDEWGGPRSYAKTVGIPLSVGAQMLAHGDIKEKGVISPEGCIDSEPFFTELAKRGIYIHEKREVG
jgi:saccharopine dehydrogenase-like NADP-dependent oxidoreductase